MLKHTNWYHLKAWQGLAGFEVRLKHIGEHYKVSEGH